MLSQKEQSNDGDGRSVLSIASCKEQLLIAQENIQQRLMDQDVAGELNKA
jgi:hypothetical protein